MRREKENVQKDLPTKTETTVFIPMVEIQREAYQKLLQDFKEADPSPTLFPTLVSSLRKVCSHPWLVENDYSDCSDIGNMINSSGKVKILDKLLVKLHQEGHRTLIFSQFQFVLDLLGIFLVARGYKFVRLDGSTNRVRRLTDQRRFNEENSELTVYLISTRAGGVGGIYPDTLFIPCLSIIYN